MNKERMNTGECTSRSMVERQPSNDELHLHRLDHLITVLTYHVTELNRLVDSFHAANKVASAFDELTVEKIKRG